MDVSSMFPTASNLRYDMLLSGCSLLLLDARWLICYSLLQLLHISVDVDLCWFGLLGTVFSVIENFGHPKMLPVLPSVLLYSVFGLLGPVFGHEHITQIA